MNKTKVLIIGRPGSARHGIDVRDILPELGRCRMVGGQEDMIVDVTLDLVARRDRIAKGGLPSDDTTGRNGASPLEPEVSRA